MKVSYRLSFLKDLRRIRGAPEFGKVRKIVFEDVLKWSSDLEGAQVKRLTSKVKAYRIRVGEYRIGFYVSDDTVIFARVLNRSEIYRYFP